MAEYTTIDVNDLAAVHIKDDAGRVVCTVPHGKGAAERNRALQLTHAINELLTSALRLSARLADVTR